MQAHAEGLDTTAKTYPWYDSSWLAQYWRARAIVARVAPGRLAQFVDAFRVLRTRPDFRTRILRQPFDAAALESIRAAGASLAPSQLEVHALHEARTFKRFVVHDLPLFTALQRDVVPLVSEAAGEEVEPSYNFLSLYTANGICPVHMDAPDAKWTLDLCVDLEVPWPLYISAVQPWPEPGDARWSGDDWQERIKAAPGLHFEAHSMKPGEAIVFSGSSQFHYRDALPRGASGATLLFLHFIPRGAARLVRPSTWASLFGIPELASLAVTAAP
jgi:hypothetical protein